MKDCNEEAKKEDQTYDDPIFTIYKEAKLKY